MIELSSRHLVCRLFGPMELVSAGGRPVTFTSERSKRLFALLAISPGAPLPRDLLVERLWVDGTDDRLRRNLSTELWRLRCALTAAGEDPKELLIARTNSLALAKPCDIWVDAQVFEQSLHGAAAPEDCAASFHNVQKIYRGDFLADIGDTWCVVQREAYRAAFIRHLEGLLGLAKVQQSWELAIEIANRVLVEDGFLEHVHRDIMECHLRIGEPAASLRHYERLQSTLRQELAVAPAPETTALYRCIREGDHRPTLRSTAKFDEIQRHLAQIQEHMLKLTQDVRQCALQLRAIESEKAG